MARGCPPKDGLGTEKVLHESSIGTEKVLHEPSVGIIRRLERYRLQAIARRVLVEVHRISGCLRKRNKLKKIQIWQGKESGAAHYRGLQTCGSVWVCPVCAAKISERRRDDLSKAIKTWTEQGHDVLMLTLTVPHHQGEDVGTVLEHIAQPLRLMKNRKTWKRMSRIMGLRGTIRALEVTYGLNGWHVHVHLLLFVTTNCRNALQELEKEFYRMWASACETAYGGLPSQEHGVSLDGGDRAERYVSKWGLEEDLEEETADKGSKWGLEHEVTKAHVKVGGEGNLTPWDFLRALNDGKTDRDYAGLFREYADAFHGRHQLEWSRGLRELLGLGQELTDAEIAEQVEESAVLLGTLTPEQWYKVLCAEVRAELLGVAEASGWNGVIKFIESLV